MYSKRTLKSSILTIKSLQLNGLSTEEISVESTAIKGHKQLILTGLPDAALKDSKEKLKSIIHQHSQWDHSLKLLINLRPGEKVKSGSHLELAIAIAALAALNYQNLELSSRVFLQNNFFCGSLTLDGKIIFCEGSEILAELQDNVVSGYSFGNLRELWKFIINFNDLKSYRTKPKNINTNLTLKNSEVEEIHQRSWERFWIITASFYQLPIILMGPPGVGKSYLAKWSRHLLIKTNLEKNSQMKIIWKIYGKKNQNNWPILNPHPRTNLSEFIGIHRSGIMRPGIYSLAHNGILILDEFTEMNRDTREYLRTIIENKSLFRNTTKGSLYWPADFWLILTTNPCQCGYSEGVNRSKCRCSPNTFNKYKDRLSGPIIDRMGVKLFLTNKDLYTNNISKSLCSLNHQQLQDLLKKTQEQIEAEDPPLEIKEKIKLMFPHINARSLLLKTKIYHCGLTLTKNLNHQEKDFEKMFFIYMNQEEKYFENY